MQAAKHRIIPRDIYRLDCVGRLKCSREMREFARTKRKVVCGNIAEIYIFEYRAETAKINMSFNRRYDSIATTAEELTESLELGYEEIDASVREGIEQMVRHGLDNEKLPISETLEQASAIALMLLAEETRLAESAAANESATNQDSANAPEIAEPATDISCEDSENSAAALSAETQNQDSAQNQETDNCATEGNEEHNLLAQAASADLQESKLSENALLSKLQAEKFYELANRVADAYDHAKSALEIISTARNYRIAILACAYDGFDSQGLPLDIIRAFIFEIENCALAVRDNALNPECARLAMTLLELVDELTDSYTASQKTFLNAFANEFPGLEASVAFRNGNKPKPHEHAEKIKKDKPNPWGDAEPKPHKDPWAEADAKTHNAEDGSSQPKIADDDEKSETNELIENASGDIPVEKIPEEPKEPAETQLPDEASTEQTESKPPKERKRRIAAQGEKRIRKPRLPKTKEISDDGVVSVSIDDINGSDSETNSGDAAEKSEVPTSDEKPKRQRRSSDKKTETKKFLQSDKSDGEVVAESHTAKSEEMGESTQVETEL